MYLRVIGSSSFGFSISGKIEETLESPNGLQKQLENIYFQYGEFLSAIAFSPGIFGAVPGRAVR
jgi:hypothetical protein